MLEDFIYFYGSHGEMFLCCIVFIFFIIFMLNLIFNADIIVFFFRQLFIMLFTCLYLVLHNDVIMPEYKKIEKERYPCKYPIDIKYHYEYEDLNGNVNKFIGDYDSCEKNYHSNNLTCYYDNTHVQVVSYSLVEEYIYANGCDKE